MSGHHQSEIGDQFDQLLSNMASEDPDCIGRVLEILLQELQESRRNAMEKERNVRQELRENIRAEEDAYLELEPIELPHHPEEIENRLLKQMRDVEEEEEKVHQTSQSLQLILDKMASMTTMPDSIYGLTQQQLEDQEEYFEEYKLELARRMNKLRKCYRLLRDQIERAEDPSNNITIPSPSTADPPH